MKERPILFSSAMVRAILAGTKTQTRRIVSNRHLGFIGCSGEEGDPNAWGYYAEGRDFSGWMVLARGVMDLVGNNQDRASIPCPYGAVGDRLWVRETWAYVEVDIEPEGNVRHDIAYRADSDSDDTRVAVRIGKSIAMAYRENRWRPSIHMPRWASRITLEIADVRVERLQDISEADIVAEGCTVDVVAKMTGTDWIDMPTLHDAWRVGWDHINGARSPWDSNPWVWVLSFKRLP